MKRTYINFIGMLAVIGAILSGCATSASSTWVCHDGGCEGKGIKIRKIAPKRTEVAITSKAEKAALDPSHFEAPLLTWNPSLSVGVKRIDDQHAKMIYMANSLIEAMTKKADKKVIDNILDGLIAYCVTHFADEEKMMAANQYPEFDRHKQIHDKLLKNMTELEMKYESGHALVTFEIKDFLRDWIKNHLNADDKKFGAYLNDKGIY